MRQDFSSGILKSHSISIKMKYYFVIKLSNYNDKINNNTVYPVTKINDRQTT